MDADADADAYRSQLDAIAAAEKQAWFDAFDEARRACAAPAVQPQPEPEPEPAPVTAQPEGGELAVLRLALTGQGRMAVQLSRTDSLDDLRANILKSLAMTIAGAPLGPDLSLYVCSSLTLAFSHSSLRTNHTPHVWNGKVWQRHWRPPAAVSVAVGGSCRCR